jgi:PAS domain S-box-containing protein
MSDSTLPSSPSPDAFFAALVSSSSDAIISKTLDGVITSWNKGAERIFGYTAAEIVGRRVDTLFPADRLDEEPGILDRIRRGEPIEHYETVRRRKDGTFVDISLTVSPIFDIGGSVIGASKVARDIGDRREAELAAQRLAAIVEGTDDAIISKNLQGVVTTWNPAAERIFGFTADEMVGKPIIRVIPRDRLDEEQQILARIQRGERVDHFQTVRHRKDGRQIHVSLTISPIRDRRGLIIGASKIARDITELKQAQDRLRSHAEELELRVRDRTARLQESIAELEAFSYSLSHDMRAPLRAIQGLTELVVEDYGDRIPEGLPHLKRVIDAAARLDRLIQDVLSFTRLSRAEIEVGPVDVEALVRGILNERPELGKERAAVQIESPLALVRGHEASLTQCLANLLDNAVKFVAPGVRPLVRVYTELVPGRVRVYVSDNGIGIDEAGQRRLFGMFQRLSPEYDGTGVGLAIVRRAAQRMNGTAGVRSSPGAGSTFWVELPRA